MPQPPYGFSTFKSQIESAAKRYNIPWSYLAAIIQWESGFNPSTRGKAGEVGLGQVMPKESDPAVYGTQFADRPTASELLDPTFNIEWTAQFLASKLAMHGGNPVEAYFGAGGYNPGASRGVYQASFTNVINQWAQWEDIQQFPENIPEGGVEPPLLYPKGITERRALQEPIQDAEPYYEGYWADIERQERILAEAYNNLAVSTERLSRAQPSASFWNMLGRIGLRAEIPTSPLVAKVLEPLLTEYHQAQEELLPVADLYYLEQLKLHTYHHLPEGIMIGEVMSPQDAIDFIKDKIAEALGEDVADRTVSPEYEAFVSDLFHKLSFLRYDPEASCEDLTNALISPTRPRPMAFGITTPASEILRRQRLPTEPIVAAMGTFQEMRDIYLACGMEFPEEMLSVKKSWEDEGVKAVERATTYELFREGLIDPHLRSLTARESLSLALTQPATAMLQVYQWYYRRYNAPFVTYAWEHWNNWWPTVPVLSQLTNRWQQTPGGRPWQWESVPDTRMDEYNQLKTKAMEAGMAEQEARVWAWENLNMPGVNRLVWEILFDPANILAWLSGGVAGFVKAGGTELGYEVLSKAGYGTLLTAMNAPNDILAAPFLAGKQMWKAIPKTPFAKSRDIARRAFTEVDSFLVRAFPGQWPRMTIDDTYRALSGAVDAYAAAPYATEALTQETRAGYSLTRAAWRHVTMEEAVVIATKLGVPEPEKVITPETLKHIRDIWRKVGLSEASGFLKPREAAEQLLEVLGHGTQSNVLLDAAEKIWRSKQDSTIQLTKRLLQGRSTNTMLRNWFERVAESAYQNWMDYDWQFAEGSKFLGRSLRVGDTISKLAPVQWAAGVNRRFASWVLYFPNFGPMNYLETAFRSHRMGVGMMDALFPSTQTFSELQNFAYLRSFPYELRPGVAPPRLTGLLMGEPGENIMDDIYRARRIQGRVIPGITEPARFSKDLIKKAPFLKRWNDLPDALRMLPGSPAWNDWWALVGQQQRAASLLASFDRNLLEAAPDTMRAIDGLMKNVTDSLEQIRSITPREVDEISHGLWRAAQTADAPETIRAMTHDPNWYRRARFVQDVQEAASHFPHLERNIADEVVNMAERGEFTSTASVDDGFDKILRAWKQGWNQRMDDAASRIRLYCSQVTAVRPTTPDQLMATLRGLEDILRIHDDVLSAGRSAVTEAAHDVVEPGLKEAMHDTQYLTQLQYMLDTGRSFDYTANLLEAQVKGLAPPPIDWEAIPFLARNPEDAAALRGAKGLIQTEILDKLPNEMQSHVKRVFVDYEACEDVAAMYRLKVPVLGFYDVETGTAVLQRVPTTEDISTFAHEIFGHGWISLRGMHGDYPFFLDAVEAFKGLKVKGIEFARLTDDEAAKLTKYLKSGGVLPRTSSMPSIPDEIFEEWKHFEEDFADWMSGYISAPVAASEMAPDVYNFFEAHLAPKLPDIPLTPEDQTRALDFINYLREHRAITVVTRDTIQEEFNRLLTIYPKKGPAFWNAYYPAVEKEWATAKSQIAKIHTRYGAKFRLQAAGYDILPVMKPITRPLTMGDLADVSGRTADSIKVVKPEGFLLMSEEEFAAFFRGEAGAVGMSQGLADNAEDAADALGFTRDEVGRVYREALREIGLEPSVASAISPTVRAVDALRDEVKVAFDQRMIPTEDVAKINAIVEDLASKREALPHGDEWLGLQESVMEKTRGDFELEHVNITDVNIFDSFMKGTFPFWTYESQRWPWLLRTFIRSPHVAANLGRYMNYTDRGYIQLPGTDLRWNPFGGTIFMSAFARLQMRDYPEFYDQIPGLSEPIGAMMRMGFYPGFVQTVPFVVAGFIDRNKRPQFTELMPAWMRAPLDAFLAKYPESGAAKALRDGVFNDRFRDYYTMQMVDKLAYQRGIDIYGTRLWEKMEQGVTLTAEEQSLWNEASGIVAKFGILSMTTGWFTLRPEERAEAYDASAKMIEEFTGVPQDLQEEAMRKYAVTGKRFSDVFPLPPFESYMLREVEKINRFARSTYTTPLMPSGWQKQRIRTGQYWEGVEGIWDTARHVGWIEEGYMSLDYLEQAFTTGVIEEGELVVMSAADYTSQVGRTLEYASSAVSTLSEDEYYKYNLETHDGVPKTLEERADYYEHHGIPMPTYHPLQELLYAYYDLTPELKYNEDTGAMERDFDSYYALTNALIESIPVSVRGQFMDRLMAEWTPMRKLQWSVTRDYFQPYRAIREMIIDSRPSDQQSVIRQYARADDLKRDELRAVLDDQGLSVISQFETDLRTARQNIRLATPELDAWLLFWGKTSATLTPAAEQLYLNLLKQYRPAAIAQVSE